MTDCTRVNADRYCVVTGAPELVTATRVSITVEITARVRPFRFYAIFTFDGQTRFVGSLARDAYYLTYAAIQKDVMVYGPVEASLDVYDDFVSYESGERSCDRRKCNGRRGWWGRVHHPPDGWRLLFVLRRTTLVFLVFFFFFIGIYVKSANATYLGGHSVKLIGWGETDGVPYWLLVNSWGEHWGDNGTFKIRRGTNECGIDNSTTAGVPVVYWTTKQR